MEYKILAILRNKANSHKLIYAFWNKCSMFFLKSKLRIIKPTKFTHLWRLALFFRKATRWSAAERDNGVGILRY